MFSKLLIALLLVAAQAEPEGEAEQAPPAPERQQAAGQPAAEAGKIIIRLVPAGSFEKVVQLLEENKLAEADRLLDERINFLKKARSSKWQVLDGEPPLLQSLLVSSRLKIARGDYDAVLEIFDYLTTEFDLSHPTALARTIAGQTARAKRSPERFRESVVKMAQLTWMFRLFQQDQ